MSRFKRVCRYNCLMLLLASSLVVAAKDPTRPPGKLSSGSAAASVAEVFKVGSVIVGGGRKLAVINGKRVMVGDRVDGAKVVGIKADTVTLDVEGQYKRISINKPLQMKRLKRDKN